MFTPWKKSIMYHVTCIMGFLSIILTISYLLPTVHAQTPAPTASSLPTTTYQLPANVSPTSPIYTDLIVHNMFHTFSCLLVGGSVIGQPCLTYQAQADAQGVIRTVPVLSQVDTSGGLLGTTSSLIGALYTNRPIRTADYIASVKKDFGIVKEAKAQVVGSGATILNPILALWQVSRNISYVIMVLILVLIGLMIIFRQKINPQTVISAQAALPSLVMGLILITFSFFLASLITDTAFISTNFVGYYFASAIDPSRGSLVEQLAPENMLSIGTSFAGKLGFTNIWGIADQVIDNLDTDGVVSVQRIVSIAVGLMAYQLGSAIGSAGGALFAAIAGGATAAPTAGASVPLSLALAPIAAVVGGPLVGTAFAGAAYAAPGFSIGIALYLAALFAVLYSIFRLFLNLLNNYLSIIFLTVTAPFHFLAASLPGKQEIASAWVRNLLANVLVFPAVIAVFYFAAYLLGDNEIRAFGITTQLQVTSSKGTLPLFGGLDLSFIRVLLAFGAILAVPKVPEIISRAVGKPGAWGQLIGSGVQEGLGGGQRYGGQFRQGFAGTVGDIRQNWGRWKGSDPYSSQAQKFQTSTGYRLPGWLQPTKVRDFREQTPGLGQKPQIKSAVDQADKDYDPNS